MIAIMPTNWCPTGFCLLGSPSDLVKGLFCHVHFLALKSPEAPSWQAATDTVQPDQLSKRKKIKRCTEDFFPRHCLTLSASSWGNCSNQLEVLRPISTFCWTLFIELALHLMFVKGIYFCSLAQTLGWISSTAMNDARASDLLHSLAMTGVAHVLTDACTLGSSNWLRIRIGRWRAFAPRARRDMTHVCLNFCKKQLGRNMQRAAFFLQQLL